MNDALNLLVKIVMIDVDSLGLNSQKLNSFISSFDFNILAESAPSHGTPHGLLIFFFVAKIVRVQSGFTGHLWKPFVQPIRNSRCNSEKKKFAIGYSNFHSNSSLFQTHFHMSDTIQLSVNVKPLVE